MAEQLLAIVSAASASAAMAFAAPASATTFAWTQGGDGDVWSQAITPELASRISFSGEDSRYEAGIIGPMAHSHGQNVNWLIVLKVDGVDQTVYTHFLTNNEQQSINAIRTISFAGGLVSSVGFTCDNCSELTYHQFSDTMITLSAVPEPKSWAMMITGFGLIGAAARRRRTASARITA